MNIPHTYSSLHNWQFLVLASLHNCDSADTIFKILLILFYCKKRRHGNFPVLPFSNEQTHVKNPLYLGPTFTNNRKWIRDTELEYFIQTKKKLKNFFRCFIENLKTCFTKLPKLVVWFLFAWNVYLDLKLCLVLKGG